MPSLGQTIADDSFLRNDSGFPPDRWFNQYMTVMAVSDGFKRGTGRTYLHRSISVVCDFESEAFSAEIKLDRSVDLAHNNLARDIFDDIFRSSEDS